MVYAQLVEKVNNTYRNWDLYIHWMTQILYSRVSKHLGNFPAIGILSSSEKEEMDSFCVFQMSGVFERAQGC